MDKYKGVKVKGFYTHLPMLKMAVSLTNGPVLEIGCGNGSTPILHKLCKNRLLYTIETDKAWLQKFDVYNSDKHKLVAEDDYEKFDSLIRETQWDVVLVDHVAERRNIEIAKLHHAKYVVVHDTQDPRYQFQITFPTYKYSFQYKKLFPWTTVLSDVSFLNEFSTVS